MFKHYAWFWDITKALEREKLLLVCFDRFEILGKIHPHYKEAQQKVNKELGDIAIYLAFFGVDYSIL